MSVMVKVTLFVATLTAVAVITAGLLAITLDSGQPGSADVPVRS
jgi:hypothetical protein